GRGGVSVRADGGNYSRVETAGFAPPLGGADPVVRGYHRGPPLRGGTRENHRHDSQRLARGQYEQAARLSGRVAGCVFRGDKEKLMVAGRSWKLILASFAAASSAADQLTDKVLKIGALSDHSGLDS